jgi:predicted NAD/FAD-binding protein
MKIAIIGTGIAGNVAAYKLRQDHDITVFEAGSYVGGHTNTIDVYDNDQRIAVDTGFIVFNDRTYPNFIRLLDEIGQESQPSEMSFSVQAEYGELEYSGSSLNTLFAQRKNILRPPFYRMIRDILRFNESTMRDAGEFDESQNLGEYLCSNGYSHEFVDNYLIPMAAAIWSAEPSSILNMPVRFLVRFFANHGLLQLRDRPVWRVIKGGSREYVHKLVAGHRDRIRLVLLIPFAGSMTASNCTRRPVAAKNSISSLLPVTATRRSRCLMMRHTMSAMSWEPFTTNRMRQYCTPMIH